MANNNSKKYSHFNVPTFARYAVVGVIGTAIDFGTLVLFVECFSVPPLLANLFAFLFAVTNNYVLNRRWTYKEKEAKFFQQMAKFFLVSIVGLLLNSSLMYLFLEIGVWYVFAKVCIIGVVMVWNFTANSLWTFKRH